MDEEWRDIPGYEGLYQISSFGRVKTLIQRYKAVMFLKTNPTKEGYLGMFLYKNKNRKRFSVHRLVAIIFVENPNKYPVVNHKDCNKQNNRADNLEWVTYSQNIIHAIKNGVGTAGEINGMSKLTARQVRHIRKVYKPFDKKYGNKALAKKYGVNIATMNKIVKGKSYKNYNEVI